MKLGRVVGTVVTPVQHPAYDGRRLLAVRPVDPDGSDTAEDRMYTAVDRAHAGVGDLVLLMAEGAVVGVVDEVAVGDRVLYPEP